MSVNLFILSVLVIVVIS